VCGSWWVLAAQFENNYSTEMCSDSEVGSYSRLNHFMFHSNLGSRVIEKKHKRQQEGVLAGGVECVAACGV